MALTVATVGLELVHMIVAFVAVDGLRVALRVTVLFVESVEEEGVNRIEVTGMTPILTVTLHVAVLPRSAVMAEIVAVPPATAVTVPEEDTVAIAALLVVQTTVLRVAFEGATVATRGDVPPIFRARLVKLSATPVTGMPVFAP